MRPVLMGVVAYKGGVGKTTLTTLLGLGLSLIMNKKVLLVDLDPQANLTEAYLTRRVFEETVVEAYESMKAFSIEFFLRPDRDPIIVKIRETFDNLYILPSHHRYMRALELLNIPVDLATTARARLGELAERFGFDYIILDLPPQMYHLVTPIASISTDYIVSPASKGAFSDVTIYYMLQTFYEASKTLRKAPGLNKYLGVVLVRFSTRETRNVEAMRRRITNLVKKFVDEEKVIVGENVFYPDPVFNTVVYYNPVLSKLRGVIVGKTPYIVKVFRKHYAGNVYYDRLIENTRELVNELMERVRALAGGQS